ncbi:MAG: hypothetical protein Q7R31_03265 [Candidatus Levybacteria bacterium]|nr:hypothetical protein [Candidatus Levybacteria bacterium]
MKLPLTIKKFNLDTVLVFVLTLAISIKDFLFSCVSFSQFSFDYQIPLSWYFAASKNLLPYRDIYYPYGIMFYFRDHNIVLSLFYLILMPVLFTGIFILFMKLWGNRVFAYISFISLFIFIAKFSGWENFNRYGIILLLTLIFSFIFAKKECVGKKMIFTMGFITGVIFSLVNDQGIYVLAVFILFLATDSLIRHSISKLFNLGYCFLLVRQMLVFFIGLVLGISPYVYFLIANKAVLGFINYLKSLLDFSLYAKTPFIPFSMTSDNIFTFLILSSTILLLVIKLASFRKISSLASYMEIGIVFVILLLEQKSFIRSISTQITFISFLLFLILFYEICLVLIRCEIKYYKIVIYYILLCLVILFALSLHPMSFYTEINYAYKGISIDKECLKTNLVFLSSKDEKYILAKETIRKDARSSTKIFDYLSDPIFYPLFNQNPPFYFTIFEATPEYAQNRNIEYIKKNKINYVIYNTDVVRLQDGVPDYARQNKLFKFILNNFSVYDKVDNFIIFKRTANGVWENDNLDKIPSFRQYILNVNLESIPKSEGIYKSKTINKLKQIASSNSINEINNFFTKNNISSDDKILVLTPDSNISTKKTEIIITTNDLETTAIIFNKCDANDQCIINLSNVPLFYKNRTIKKIEIDKNFSGNIKILNGNSPNSLW